MSPGELREAAAAILERKKAAGAPAAVLEGSTKALEEAMRRTLVGLDLDLDEARDQGLEYGPMYMAAQMFGVPPASIVAGAWVDGVMVGLLLAERRQREEAS